MLLAALRARDGASEALYRFAAPKLRRQTLDATTFARILENGRYAPLLGHRSSALGDLAQLGDSARQAVTVEAESGTVPYLFALLRGADGVWRLSGISRPDALE